MNKKLGVLCLTLVFTVVLSLFTSCEKKRNFEASGVTGASKATEASTEATTYAVLEDKLNFGGVQMGMTTDRVQITIGQANPVYSKNDKMFLTGTVSGIQGLDKSLEKTVYYIFGYPNNLVEIQYVVASADDITYKSMVDSFKALYGKGVEIKSEIGKTETIWEYKDVYAVVAKEDDRTTIVSYFEKAAFESENTADVKTYNNTK